MYSVQLLYSCHRMTRRSPLQYWKIGNFVGLCEAATRRPLTSYRIKDVHKQVFQFHITHAFGIMALCCRQAKRCKLLFDPLCGVLACESRRPFKRLGCDNFSVIFCESFNCSCDVPYYKDLVRVENAKASHTDVTANQRRLIMTAYLLCIPNATIQRVFEPNISSLARQTWRSFQFGLQLQAQ